MTLTREHLLLACVCLIATISVGCAEKKNMPAARAAAETKSAGTEPFRTGVPAESLQKTANADGRAVAEPAVKTISETEEEPATQYRIPDAPPDINRQRLAAAGIHVLESRRLILLTDRDPESVRDLPPLADKCFQHLKDVCGPLRPSRSGLEFQAIGCLMSDFELFQSMGLVPGPVVEMQHGQQFGYRFWMRDQAEDYYRRHLLLHEFVHVYMTCDTGLNDIPDGWFMEGAAEVFATHTTADGRAVFGVLPKKFAGFEGWGRISTIRRRRVDRVPANFAIQPIPAINLVQYPRGSLAQDEARYSWWWALSWMLCNHPDYAAHWTGICHSRGKDEFQRQVADLNAQHAPRVSSDWLLFAESLSEGFDTQRSFPQHRNSEVLSPHELTLQATLGWQDSGWILTAGQRLAIECSGKCVMEQTAGPWYAEPNGITLEYNKGRPLGEVVAVQVGSETDWISRRIVIGKNGIITASRPGRLWLQINDDAGARAGNSGSYQVSFRQLPPLRDDDG